MSPLPRHRSDHGKRASSASQTETEGKGATMINFKKERKTLRGKSISKFLCRSGGKWIKINVSYVFQFFVVYSVRKLTVSDSGTHAHNGPPNPPTPIQFLSLREWNFSLMGRQWKWEQEESGAWKWKLGIDLIESQSLLRVLPAIWWRSRREGNRPSCS